MVPIAWMLQQARGFVMARLVLNGHFRSGPSYKVALALSLMDLPFSYRHIDLRAGEQKTPEFLAKNRFGQVPVLEHGDLALCQSAAIMAYLGELTGKFLGKNSIERVRVREWLYWSFDKLAPPIYRSRGIRAGFRQAGPEIVEMYAGEGKAALAVIDAALAGHSFLVGEHPSIADVDAYGVIVYAEDAGFALSAYPNIVAWMRRFEALPGFGKPDDLLPKESRP